MHNMESPAQQKITLADHLLSTTYSLVKEPKLLISVIENLSAAMELAITELLEQEKNLKTIGIYGKTFDEKIEVFRRKIMPKHNINPDILEFISDLRKTVEEHKKSTVEFTKKQKYIISDNDYNMRTLTADDIKKKLTKTRSYVKDLMLVKNRFG